MIADHIVLYQMLSSSHLFPSSIPVIHSRHPFEAPLADR
jgi:hypothetical protein